MEPFRGTLQLRRRFFLQRDHRHLNALAPGTFENENGNRPLPAIRPIPLRWFLRWP